MPAATGVMAQPLGGQGANCGQVTEFSPANVVNCLGDSGFECQNAQCGAHSLKATMLVLEHARMIVRMSVSL